MATPIDIILSRLEEFGHAPKRSGKGWRARCPAHDDKNPSLSIDQGDDGRALVCCHAACDTQAILAALRLSAHDLFPSGNGATTSRNGKPDYAAHYDYRDEKGELLIQVVRLSPKGFFQRQPKKEGGGWEKNVKGARRVVYRLPELLAAQPDEPVFIVEGEKDADRLTRLELVATTNAGGAGKWLHEYADSFGGRRVVILPDNDSPGRDHAQAVAKSLHGIAASVRVVELPGLPEKGDVSDWLDKGGTTDKLRALAEQAPEWQSTSADPSAAICLADVRAEEVRWLWPGRIACGKLTLIQGDPEVGKSFLTLDIAARVSTGKRV